MPRSSKLSRIDTPGGTVTLVPLLARCTTNEVLVETSTAAAAAKRSKCTRSAFQAARTPADVLTAHVVNLNKFYDIHYHTFSPTSLFEFTAHFCRRERCELLDVRKSGGGEAIAVLRKIE